MSGKAPRGAVPQQRPGHPRLREERERKGRLARRGEACASPKPGKNAPDSHISPGMLGRGRGRRPRGRQETWQEARLQRPEGLLATLRCLHVIPAAMGGARCVLSGASPLWDCPFRGWGLLGGRVGQCDARTWEPQPESWRVCPEPGAREEHVRREAPKIGPE